MKLDIVLQGECTDFTKTIIAEYRKLPFVENIILSTYENSHIPDDVNVIFNELISPRGLGNRNLQINTSKNGLSLVQSKYCIKMRTDQLIRDMPLMYEYWKNDKREDGKVFVMGMYKAFPYHPRDHVFWGRTEDVVNVFDVPFDIERGSNQDYTYYSIEPGIKYALTDAVSVKAGYRFRDAFNDSYNEKTNTVRFGAEYAVAKDQALTLGIDRSYGASDFIGYNAGYMFKF
jgi:hypothetical protein